MVSEIKFHAIAGRDLLEIFYAVDSVTNFEHLYYYRASLQVAKQFSKFVVVGVLSTIVNYSCFWILLDYLHLNYLLASGSGFMIGVFAGYGLNKSWTFGQKQEVVNQVTKYYGVYLVSLILGLLLLKALTSFWGLEPKIANIIVIGFTTLTNFAGIKCLVFKK